MGIFLNYLAKAVYEASCPSSAPPSLTCLSLCLASEIPACSQPKVCRLPFLLAFLLATTPVPCSWPRVRGALEGSLERLRHVGELRGVSDPNPELPTVLHYVCCSPAPGNTRCPLCFTAQACENAPEQVCPAGSTHCYSGVLSLMGGKLGHGDSGGQNTVSPKECGANLPELG